jgi:hypothetical protein
MVLAERPNLRDGEFTADMREKSSTAAMGRNSDDAQFDEL